MPSRSKRLRGAWSVGLLAALTALPGCGRKPSAAQSQPSKPNIVWVVWDTVRADHLSLYGYDKPTTPHLDEWAKNARVFEDCQTPASTTVPSHASMFTGLMPSEHGANNKHEYLEGRFETLAEILKAAGYRTYLWSSNAFVSKEQNFTQGFDLVEHPWSPAYADDAQRIVSEKIVPEDRSSELPERLRAGRIIKQNIKAAGSLAARGVTQWLAETGNSQPFFAFVNWMEAHRQLVPPRRLRERFMTPEQLARSYQVDRSWNTTWAYTVGLHEYSDDDIQLTRLTYDAAVAELDEMFHELLAALEKAGKLRDTIIVLTADHGEHLGEHHMLDHQYSLYDVLLRIPLIVYYPAKVPAGREARPVMNFDLFPTLLELTGLPPPAGLESQAVSLLHPLEKRVRVAEYPAAMLDSLKLVQKRHPRFDPRPWLRGLRSYRSEPQKLIWSSDGRRELYDIAADPAELQNLAPQQPDAVMRLTKALDSYLAALMPFTASGPPPKRSAEQTRRLQSVGYAGGGEEEDDEDGKPPASAPATQPGASGP